MGTHGDEMMVCKDQCQGRGIEADLLVCGVAGEDEEVMAAPLNPGKFVFVEAVKEVGIFDFGEFGELFQIGGRRLIDMNPATIAHLR